MSTQSIDVTAPNPGLQWQYMVAEFTQKSVDERVIGPFREAKKWFETTRDAVVSMHYAVNAVRSDPKLSPLGKQEQLSGLADKFRALRASSPIESIRQKAEGYRHEARNRTLRPSTDDPAKLADLMTRARTVWAIMANWPEERRDAAITRAMSEKDIEGLHFLRSAPRILGLLTDTQREILDEALIEVGLTEGERENIQVMETVVQALNAMDETLKTYPNSELRLGVHMSELSHSMSPDAEREAKTTQARLEREEEARKQEDETRKKKGARGKQTVEDEGASEASAQPDAAKAAASP